MDPASVALFCLSSVACTAYTKLKLSSSQEQKNYHGSCHCKAVQFIAKSTRHLIVWNCDCSICLMKKNWHFIVPEKNFTFIQGKENLTEYTFNTKVAKHMFCRICGVQAFYRPRSNPDGYAVTLACIDSSDVSSSMHIDNLMTLKNYLIYLYVMICSWIVMR
jgi:hypothetical protein